MHIANACPWAKGGAVYKRTSCLNLFCRFEWALLFGV